MGQRFFQITPDISVQYWLEFIGAKAVWVKDFEWPEKVYIPKDPNRKTVTGIPLDETARFYLTGEVVTPDSVGFERSAFTGARNPIFDQDAGEVEDFCKLQFHRENGARIVHYRPSDENPFLGGFGRTNPHTISEKYPNGRNCHNDFSETFVDRKPGTTFTKYRDGVPVGEEIWHGFEPVYLKIKLADGRDEYYLKIWTEWCDSTIFVMSETNPADVPQELRDHEFPAKNKTQELDAFEEDAIKKYRHSLRVRR